MIIRGLHPLSELLTRNNIIVRNLTAVFPFLLVEASSNSIRLLTCLCMGHAAESPAEVSRPKGGNKSCSVRHARFDDLGMISIVFPHTSWKSLMMRGEWDIFSPLEYTKHLIVVRFSAPYRRNFAAAPSPSDPWS